MNEYTYSVIVENEVIAEGMTIGNAMILVKALFIEWHSEANMKICIQRNLLERCIADTGD